MGERNTIITVALVIFVALAFIFGGVAFYFNLEAQALRNKMADEKKVAENLREKIGQKSPPSGIIAEIEKVKTATTELETQLTDANSGLTAKAKDAEGLAKTHREAAGKAHSERKDADKTRRDATDKYVNELSVKYRDLVDSLEKLEKELAGHMAELKKEQDNLLQVKSGERGKSEGLRKQLLAIKARVDILEAKLGRMKERQKRLYELHKDGVVITADAETNLVVVDLGARQGVRPGMVFDVFEVKKDGRKVRKGKLRLRRVDSQQSRAVLLAAREAPKTCPQCGWQTFDVTHRFCPYCLGGDDDKEREAQRLAEGSVNDRIVAPEFLNPVRKGDYVSSPFYLGRLKKKAFTFAMAGQPIERSRQEIATFLKRNGCALVEEITVNTDFAIVGIGPRVETDMERARKMGVSLLREAELFDFFGKMGTSPDVLPDEGGT